MAENSKIEWTEHTFNPWWGCTKVSPACDHCYAEAWAKRTGHSVWGAKSGRRLMSESHWLNPLRWDRAVAESGARARHGLCKLEVDEYAAASGRIAKSCRNDPFQSTLPLADDLRRQWREPIVFCIRNPCAENC